MNLYTEEQIKKHKEILEDIIDLWENGLPLDSNTVNKCKNASSELTPIELPSNEEIDKKSENCSWGVLAFQIGANWIIEQIKKQANGN